MAIKKKLNYRQSIKKTFVLPAFASFLMAIAVLGVYYGLKTLTHMVAIPLMISVIVGIIVYFVVIFYLYADHPEELECLPYASRILNKIKRGKV